MFSTSAFINDPERAKSMDTILTLVLGSMVCWKLIHKTTRFLLIVFGPDVGVSGADEINLIEDSYKSKSKEDSTSNEKVNQCKF